MDAKTNSIANDENHNPNVDRHKTVDDKSELVSVRTTKVRKSKVPKPGDLLVVPVELITVSPNKARKMMPKKPRSEKQLANDIRLRGVQKEKKVDSDAKKELIKAAEQKLLDDTKTVKIKVLPKRVRVKKIHTEEKDTPVEPDSHTDSDDEEIKKLKKHVKKVSIKKELYDQLNNIKNDTLRSKTPVLRQNYDGLMSQMFR